MQSDAINKFAIQMNMQWAFMDLLLQVAGEIGKERHAALSFLQKSCSTLQLRILVHVMSHNVMLLYAFSAINLQHLTAFQKGNSMIAAGWLWQTSTTISLLCPVLNPWRLSLAVGMMDSDKLTYYILPRSWCPLSSYIPSTLWSLSATRALLRALVATWSFHRQIIHQWPLDSEKNRPNASKVRLQTARYLLHVSASMVYALGFALMYLGMFSPSRASGECQRNQIWWHDDMILVPRWPHRTPQLFINYRMKSVAYLPWKRFIYSFLFEFQAGESQDVPCKQTCFCQYQVHVHLTESKGQSTRSLTLGSKTGRWSIWAVQTCHPEFLFVFFVQHNVP